MECSICGTVGVKLYNEEGGNSRVLLCGINCQKEYHGFVGEGVVDFNNNVTYLKSFDLNNEESRKNVIRAAFIDVDDTYEKERTKRFGKMFWKPELIKKLNHFRQAVKDLMVKRGDLSLEEKKIYASYVHQVDEWIALLKK